MQNQNGGQGNRPARGNGERGSGYDRTSVRGTAPVSGNTSASGRSGSVQNSSRSANSVPQRQTARSAGYPVQNRNGSPASVSAPSRSAPQKKPTGGVPASGNTPNGYRAAGPYTVPPRHNRERLPYPTREAYLKKKKKERRRKRLILLGILAVIVLLIFLLLFFTVRSLVRKFREQHGETHPGTEVTDTLGADTGENDSTDTAPPVTEPLPDYDAPHALRADAPIPYVGKNTVTLGSELGCPYAVFLDAETGEILAQKFETKSVSEEDGEKEPSSAPDIIHARIYPASMTKLMTVLIAYEQCENLDDTFRMTYEIIDPLYLSELALAGFVGGENVTVRDLLYGAALPSGAEAAMGLALYTSGDEKTFVSLMNDRARLLGMKGTHFTNCTGLHDPNHYSTLTDIAILISYMEQDPGLAEILGAYQYTTAPTPQHPEGVLLTSTVFSRMEGSESGVCEIIGGKTGYTTEAQQCLAVYGIRKDTHHPFAAVFAGADTKWKPVYDAIYLYQFHTGDPPAPETQDPAEAPG